MRILLVGLLLLVLAIGLAILHRRRKRRSRALPRGDSTVVMHTAGFEAIRRGQRVLLPEHVVLAALCDCRVATLVASAGASAASLRRELAQHLPGPREAPTDSAALDLSPAVHAISRSVRRRRR